MPTFGAQQITITLTYEQWLDTLEALEVAYDTFLERVQAAQDDGQEWEASFNRSESENLALMYGDIAECLPAGPHGEKVSAHILRESARIRGFDD